MTTANAQAGPGFLKDYDLLEQLGEGGTGTVYRAVRRETGSVVALKVLRRDHPARPWWVERPNQLSGLQHPNLVAIHRAGTAGNGAPCLEMEYIAGPVLRRLLQAGECWPAGRCRDVLADLAGALGYLHGRGLLHLDLKPENVLCPPGRPVQLADLDGVVPVGEARLAWKRGSPDYCAPEQRFGLPVDHRADLFALATLAYELFTGRLPGRVYLSCAEFRPGLPAALDDVLCVGLARDRHDRPDTVPAFASLLARALANLPPA